MIVARLDAVAAAALTLLIASALRALVVAGVAGLVLAATRARRASVHLAGWTVVLSAAIALPALGWMLPSIRWSLPIVLPSANIAPALPEAAHAASSGTAVLPPASSNARALALEPTTTATAPTARSAPVASVPGATAPSWTVAAFSIYLCGVVALLVRAGMGWILARRLRRTASLIKDAGTRARLRASATTGGLVRPPQLAVADSLVVPITMSVLRPVILLPPAWRRWDGATLEAVLAHEVAHIARRDTLVQHLSLVYRAIFWFSPLGWWLRRTLANLAEHASDEAVLEAGVDRTVYAETVLGFFAALTADRRRAHWPAIAMARGTGASTRVERILAWTNGGPRRLPRPLLAVTTIVAGVAIVLAATVCPVASSSLSLPTEIPAVLPLATPPAPHIPPAFRAAVEPTAQRTPPASQTAAPDPDSQSISVDAVRVDVIARDAQGRSVTDLKAEDLRVFEDGVEQHIDMFLPMPIQRTGVPQTASGRVFIVLIDDLSIPSADFVGLSRLLEFIRDTLHDNDLVGIVSTGSSSIEVDLTYDRGHVRFDDAIRRVTRPAAGPPAPSSGPDAAKTRYMAHVAFRTAGDVLARAALVKDRKPTFIYVGSVSAFDLLSDATLQHEPPRDTSAAVAASGPLQKTGADLSEADLVADLATLIRAANRADVKIHAISPAGFRKPGDPSSGSPSPGAISAQGLQRIDSETSNYYLIAYATTNHDATKPMRQIEVRTVRPGLTLQYRKAYIFKQ